MTSGEGDIEAAYEYELAPTGISLNQLKASAGGITISAAPRYQNIRCRRERRAAWFQHAG